MVTVRWQPCDGRDQAAVHLAQNHYGTLEVTEDRQMQSDSFERFYYEKVALGECCGCAEQIIRTRDLDALSQQAALRTDSYAGQSGRLAWLARFFGRRGHTQQES